MLQMVEEALRLYVGTAEQLIQAAAPYGVPYRFDAQAIQNASLGKLINLFAKFNRNDALISRLRELQKHRDYIAHLAFLRAVQASTDKSIDVEYAMKHAYEVGDAAQARANEVTQEMKSLLLNFPNSRTATELTRGSYEV